MIIGWGGITFFWGKPIFIVPVRQSRYTVNSRIELAFFLTVFWAVLTRGKRAILTLF